MKFYLRPDSPTPNLVLGIFWGMLFVYLLFTYGAGMEGDTLQLYPSVLAVARATIAIVILTGSLAGTMFILRETARWHVMDVRTVSSVTHVQVIAEVSGGTATVDFWEVRFVDDTHAYRVEDDDHRGLEEGKNYSFKARRLLIDDAYIWEARDFKLALKRAKK